MKNLLLILSVIFLFIGCTKIHNDEFEYIKIPNQTKGTK